MLGGVRSSSSALSILESPWFSAHSVPGLLIALATPWSHLWTLRVFCFLGSPQGFQHMLVLKVGSPHTQQHHLGAEMQIPGPPQDLCFNPPSVGVGGVLSSGEGGTNRPTPHPNAHLGCAPWGFHEQGEKSAGQDRVGVHGGGRPSVSWRSDGAWEAQGRLGMRSSWGRGGKRRDSCRAKQLLCPEKAGRPGHRGVPRLPWSSR